MWFQLMNNANLIHPKNVHRTTIDQVFDGLIPNVGIYIVAYMGEILYVGKAESSVLDRLKNHLHCHTSRIGIWLETMEFDWRNIRIDVLEPPDNEDRYWLSMVENACIKRFNPLFNDRLMAKN